MDEHPSLAAFLPAVRQWFRATLGEPTLAQQQGWPAIAAGQNTLILAPTGSGKTLAAFLACLDGLWRSDPLPRGVLVLYISPLKALNNDIHRNLQVPLAGVAAAALDLGITLPRIEVAVRTGDTPTAERQRQIRKPPHVLITTPESLHLLLTSRGRETLPNITHCIIDEIHALSPNKRGVFLALLLERLAELNPRGFVRIGLSATQRPLDEVARFLGGSECAPDGSFLPRPVTIVDAGLRRDLDLRVISPVPQFGPLPEKSIWPSIYRLLAKEIGQHRATIVFANSRRVVERITAHLNGGAGDIREDHEPHTPQGHEEGAQSEPASPLARAHHGSVSLEMRQQTEQALKEGRVPAVVATGSLELGIDMGAVDLVCQVESTGNVARALQRVGRAGHIVGQQSKGRLIPKTLGDLLEQAVLAREMVAGRVEAIRVPVNCLDVLAQQIVAMVALEPFDVPRLYRCVRRAYPFRDLSPQAFESVLEMVSGRFRWQAGEQQPSALTALQPRVSWDRVHDRLLPLPGSQHLALIGGGTIPDTGHYAAYTSAGIRIGELDEEFIYERRIGDTFLLGTNAWRLERIDADRVFVTTAEGAPALIPFWHGEMTGRSYDLGVAIGRFLHELGQRLDDADCLSWLERDYLLDAAAAKNLHYHVRRQLAAAQCLPTDQQLVVEASRDQLGDWQVTLLSPFGKRLHLALRLALEARLRERLGYTPQCLHHDDGLLIRLTDADEPVVDLFTDLTSENVESLILTELADSALFTLRFRQNAARALLLPRLRPGKRAPLWLQRIRGRDLLQVAKQHSGFPIVVETFRECLNDHLDLPRLRQLLADLHNGKITVVVRRTEAPSPFAAALLFEFTAANMYQYDADDATTTQAAVLDRQLLDQLLNPASQAHLLDPRAVQQVERRLRGLGQPPRTATEMAEWLRRLGDITPAELEGPMASFVEELQANGRAGRVELPRCREPLRWVLTELEPTYRQAFGLEPVDPNQARAAGEEILSRFLETHALVSARDILDRYPFETEWTHRVLEEWSVRKRLLPVPPSQELEPLRWSAPANLEQVQRGSLALMRREVLTCQVPQFVEFVLRRQKLHPITRQSMAEGVGEVLGRLEGVSLPAELWEKTILPSRIEGYQSGWLDTSLADGSWLWVGQGAGQDRGPGAIAFWSRERLRQLPGPAAIDEIATAAADTVRAALQSEGAMFVPDLARSTRLNPDSVRAALWTLVRRGQVTNDRFDVVRRGEDLPPEAAGPAPRRRSEMLASSLLRAGPSPRRRSSPVVEGRWSLLLWGTADVAVQAVQHASLLLERYGVVTRELALLDPSLLPWRVLYEVLTRMELAGDVRRGYFVEGLSGAQFATPEAARILQDLHLPSTAAAPLILLHSLDPANLYGSGAPLDIPLLDGGTRPLLRRQGNWLVLRAGKPVLLAEQQGKKLSTLPAASKEDILQAVGTLPTILDRQMAGRYQLTVDTWNGEPVTASAGKDLLESAGFVRDYQGMTLYAAWR